MKQHLMPYGKLELGSRNWNQSTSACTDNLHSLMPQCFKIKTISICHVFSHLLCKHGLFACPISTGNTGQSLKNRVKRSHIYKGDYLGSCVLCMLSLNSRVMWSTDHIRWGKCCLGNHKNGHVANVMKRSLLKQTMIFFSKPLTKCFCWPIKL